MNTQNSIVITINVPTLFTPLKKTRKQKVEIELNRVHLESIIRKENGRFVSVDFKKHDGTMRTLTGRLGVKSYLKGGTNNVESLDRPYMTIFDIQLRQYRTVNLSTVVAMRYDNKICTIIDTQVETKQAA